jgi:hypothetical protein
MRFAVVTQPRACRRIVPRRMRRTSARGIRSNDEQRHEQGREEERLAPVYTSIARIGNPEVHSVTDVELFLSHTVLNDFNLVAHDSGIHGVTEPARIERPAADQHHGRTVTSVTLVRHHRGNARGFHANRQKIASFQLVFALARLLCGEIRQAAAQSMIPSLMSPPYMNGSPSSAT